MFTIVNLLISKIWLLFNIFKNFKCEKLQYPALKCDGQDDLGNFIYKTNKLIRFTNFHPTYNIEGFFNKILLKNVSFRNENEILFTLYFEKNYIHECYICHFLSSLDNLQTYLLKYAHKGFLNIKRQTQLLNYAKT
jgi:hypothetical protein